MEMDQLSVDERDVLLRVARERSDTKQFIREMSNGDLKRLRDAAYDVWLVARDTLDTREARTRNAEAARKAQI